MSSFKKGTLDTSYFNCRFGIGVNVINQEVFRDVFRNVVEQLKKKLYEIM